MLLNPKVSYRRHELGEKIWYVSDPHNKDVVVDSSEEMIRFPGDNSCTSSECENYDVLEDPISTSEESRSCQDGTSSSRSITTTTSTIVAITANEETESNYEDTAAGSSNASREDVSDSDPPPTSVIAETSSSSARMAVENEKCRHTDSVLNQTQRMQRYHELLDNMYYYLDSDDYDNHNNNLDDFDKDYDEELTSLVFLTTTTSNDNLNGDQQQTHPSIIAIPVGSGSL